MVFSFKPVFVGWIAILSQLPFLAFLTLWAGLFLGGMTSDGIGSEFRPTVILFGAAVFLLGLLIIYFGKKLNYERTEYKFFDDRIEFSEGFLTLNRKTIKYRDIKEVTLREGILQRTCGLGTVYLATVATGNSFTSSPFFNFGFGNFSASGISVRDVTNPVDTFDKIKRVVDKAVV